MYQDHQHFLQHLLQLLLQEIASKALVTSPSGAAPWLYLRCRLVCHSDLRVTLSTAGHGSQNAGADQRCLGISWHPWVWAGWVMSRGRDESLMCTEYATIFFCQKPGFYSFNGRSVQIGAYFGDGSDQDFALVVWLWQKLFPGRGFYFNVAFALGSLLWGYASQNPPAGLGFRQCFFLASWQN